MLPYLPTDTENSAKNNSQQTNLHLVHSSYDAFFMSASFWVWMWQRQEAALRLINLKNANYSVIDVSKYAKSFAHYHPVMLLRDILRKTNEWKDKETIVKQQCRSRSESLLESCVTCVRWNLWNLIRIFEISSESSESHENLRNLIRIFRIS